MVTKGRIKQGRYYDSVSLMQVAKAAGDLEGVQDVAVVMGTEENLAILRASGLLMEKFHSVSDTDLLIVVKADDDGTADTALDKVDELLDARTRPQAVSTSFHPKSLETALRWLPDANLAIISVAGKYAAAEAWKALKSGLHVMIFSDNVSLDQEIALKQYAKEKHLLVMGPDCGTAIINGAPLGFANVVDTGDIGIVAAAGTGLQEVSSIISQNGGGISQAIGTGGRDVKNEVGGTMFIEGFKALLNDDATHVITLVSKPPSPGVIEKLKAIPVDKPVVTAFLGAPPDVWDAPGVYPAQTLAECAWTALALSRNDPPENIKAMVEELARKARVKAEESGLEFAPGQRYIRGLYSGGTLCYEAQLILKDKLREAFSNAPLAGVSRLEDSWRSEKHTFIDMGEDEFTVGRPHPMIDYSLRNRRILMEARDPETAVILLDVVLGYGSTMTPGDDLAPAIEEALRIAAAEGRRLAVVCAITGTDGDPQGLSNVRKMLEDSGATVFDSNAEACMFTGFILPDQGV